MAMRLRLDQDSMSKLSIGVLGLRVSTMRNLSAVFSLVMIILFFYLGLRGFEPMNMLVGEEGVRER